MQLPADTPDYSEHVKGGNRKQAMNFRSFDSKTLHFLDLHMGWPGFP